MIEPAPERVWLVCPYLYGRGLRACERCPPHEPGPGRGEVTRGCYAVARAVVLIAQTGNEWGTAEG